ncbi:hypothetical protein Shyhy01_62740 [Streptomyces hygroscopicus subsp. hygroscopicus]|nr:hypothetical protein Shyhy01_62740 [Streptomyces hygroscopicus subsp. hygroscopicus]
MLGTLRDYRDPGAADGRSRHVRDDPKAGGEGVARASEHFFDGWVVRTREPLSGGAVAVALAAPAVTTGWGGPGGGTDPTSVVRKAQSLAPETLDAVRPTAGSAATSVEGGGGEKCPGLDGGPGRGKTPQVALVGRRGCAERVVHVHEHRFGMPPHVLRPGVRRRGRVAVTRPADES